MCRQACPPEVDALPVELVRMVFETAAYQSRATAVNLMTVSKSVQQWIAPLLYHTVVIKTSNALLSFYGTIERAKSRMACYIKALYLPPPPSPGVPPTFLINFTALQHLAISSLSFRDPPAPWMLQHNSPRPKSITITGPLGRISFQHPIFQFCTHLYLADDVPGPFALTAEMLPCLTHLACAYRHGTSSVTAVTCLPLLLAQKPSDHSYSFSDNNPSPHAPSQRTTPVELKVLIVEMYLSNGSPDVTMFVMERLGLGKTPAESQLRADPRLVPRPGTQPLTARRWENYVINDVMWTVAEREIRIQSLLKTRI